MKKEFGICFLIVMVCSLAFGIAAPSLPHSFIGTVEYSGDSSMSLVGHDISASVGGYALGIIGQIQTGNTYEVFVDSQGHVGEIIFYIGGAEADPTAVYVWGGHTDDFDLTIDELPINSLCGNGIKETGEQCDGLELGTGTCENVLGLTGATGSLSCTTICTFDYSNCSTPFCGDAVCNNGEDCNSCSADCGACPSTGGSPSGGGGGGGGGTYIPPSNTNESETNSTASPEPLNLENEKYGLTGEKGYQSSGITGAVIGVFKSPGLLSLIFIAVIGVLALIIFLIKKKKGIKKK